MKVKKITDHVYFLSGIRSSNLFYFDCQKKALLDTGHAAEIDQNLACFKSMGIDLTQVDYILTTHSHGDHIGANAFLKRNNSQIKIFGSEHKTQYQWRRNKKKILKGSEDDFEEYEIDQFVKEGDIIDLGQIQLKVLETPGHSIDSLSYYYEKDKMIFSGDLIYNRLISQLDYYQELFVSLMQLKKSYQKLQNYPIQVIYPGHGSPIENPRQNIHICLKKIKKFEHNPDLILVNTFIPVIEYYIHKNSGCRRKEIENYLLHNLEKLKSDPIIQKTTREDFFNLIEKIFSLMQILDIIKSENNRYYIAGKINQYIM